MMEPGSPAWLEAAAAALASTRIAGPACTVEHRISGGPSGTVVYHLRSDGTHVEVRPGPAAEPTVRITQSAETARAIRRGELSAKQAFLRGSLRVGGDIAVLRQARELLDEVSRVIGAAPAGSAREAQR